MVLIPKGGGGYRGIGLVEAIWKFFMSIVNSRLQNSIVLHDALRSYQQGRGTGTAIMEEKLEQQLAGMACKPLFQVFIDVRKAYDSLDRGRCMEILRVYGLGYKLQRLLQQYWDGQRVVPKSGKYYGRPFRMGIGATQGDPLSPKIFNILVDAVVRTALQEFCGPQEDQHGFAWALGEHSIYFYADDGCIAGRYPIWVQTALTTIVGMFKRVVLWKNLSKTKATICTLRFIWGQQGVEA